MKQASETVAVRETVIRYKGRRKAAKQITDPANLARFVRGVVDGDPREHAVAVYLDARHSPIGWTVVSIGTADAALVHPREVFRPAIAQGAVALCFAHNHPSGNPSPSAQDFEVTRRLAAAGKLLGVTLLDSIIVSDTAFHSMRQSNSEVFNV